MIRISGTCSPVLVLLFCFLVFFSCFSSEGILETEDTVGARNLEIQTYNTSLILYTANSCWSPKKETEGICLTALGNIRNFHDACRGAYFPYPWDRKNKCIKK